MVTLKIQNKIIHIRSLATIIIGILFSAIMLYFGAANLVNPDVPDIYLQRNFITCLLLILNALFLLLALFRPYLGGFILCVCALALLFFVPPAAIIVLLFGLLQVFGGKTRKLEIDDQATK